MQFIVPRSLHNEVLDHIHDSLIGGNLGQKKLETRPSKGFTGVVLGRIAIIGFPNAINVLELSTLHGSPMHLLERCH